MIRIDKLYKSFNKRPVLQGIDLQFRQGQITAILGPNGSGKTTMIKCLLGMVLPDKGNLFINGESVLGKYAYRERIAYLSQIARFPENLKVQELFRMLEDIRGRAPMLELLIARFDLKPYLKVKLSNLSGGTRQKVNLVLALMFDSPVLILDEPTNGLDPVAVIQLKDLIRKEKERGKTILITSHIMQFVDIIADQLVFLLDGKVRFNGSVSELKELFGEQDLEVAIAGLLQSSGMDDQDAVEPAIGADRSQALINQLIEW